MGKVRLRSEQDYGPCCQARNAIPISTIFLQLLSDKLLLVSKKVISVMSSN